MHLAVARLIVFTSAREAVRGSRRHIPAYVKIFRLSSSVAVGGYQVIADQRAAVPEA